MIYNRFGDMVEIIENCGTQNLPQFDVPVTLVRIRFVDGGSERYTVAEALKADDGINEVMSTAAALPKTELTQGQLRNIKKALV